MIPSITLKKESVCGRKFCGFCVFCPNPQKILPQKVHNLSIAKVFSAKITKKVIFPYFYHNYTFYL